MYFDHYGRSWGRVDQWSGKRNITINVSQRVPGENDLVYLYYYFLKYFVKTEKKYSTFFCSKNWKLQNFVRNEIT